MINKIFISIFLVIYAIIVKKNISSKGSISIYNKEVSKYMAAFAVLYLALYYMVGIYTGYYRAIYNFGFSTLINHILPLILIIISSEILRKEFLSIDTKFSKLMIYVYGIIIDLIVYTNIYSLNTLNGILEAFGYAFFFFISSNALYNYTSDKFGCKPNIIYRIITTIYLYIMPITPDVHIYFRITAKIIYPILIYLVLQDSYEKKHRVLEIKNKGFQRIITAITIILIFAFTMLITCSFKYGIIVIGSSSMEKTLYKGDAVIFDTKYKNVNVGDIILFKRDNLIVVHRVVEIKNTNGEVRLYTKGDNNIQNDEGHVLLSEVIGVTKLKIKKIGLPTIWVNELFK